MTEISNLIASSALVLLTGILAWYTRTLAKEARATRLQQIQPQVVVTIEPRKFTNFMNLVIANVGQGIAREIRIKADPDFKLEKKKGENMFNEYSFLELDLLKPGQEIKHYIGSFQYLSRTPTKISSTCLDVSGKQHTFTAAVDVSVLGGLSRLGEDPFERTAKNVEKIAQSLAKVSDFQRLRVDCYSSDDRRSEREEHEKWVQETRTEQAKSNSGENEEN